MHDVLLLSTIGLGLAFAVALLWMVRGGRLIDRMLTAQLLGTNGVGLLLLLSFVLGVRALIDVALVLALLAAVAVIAFTRETQVGDDA